MLVNLDTEFEPEFRLNRDADSRQGFSLHKFPNVRVHEMHVRTVLHEKKCEGNSVSKTSVVKTTIQCTTAADGNFFRPGRGILILLSRAQKIKI